MNAEKFITLIADEGSTIEQLLAIEGLSHSFKVKFALHCAKDARPNLDLAKYPELAAKVDLCLRLTETWLVNPEKVSVKELEAASNAAYSAAYAGADAADNQADAASNAAYSAAYSAYSAAYSASSAVNAARSFGNEEEPKLKEYKKHLISLITHEHEINNNTIQVLYT